jgi:hypothetical protein
MVPLPTIVAWPPTMTSVIRPSCLASAWARLGAAVKLLAQDDGMLPRMEPFAGELIARAFI